MHHRLDIPAQILAVKHLTALLVDDLPLDVHHVVVFQHALTRLIVAALHGLLRVFDRAGENFCVDGRVLVDAERLHHVLHPLRAEQPHDVILKRKEKARLTGVTLTSGAPAELIVDPARLVPLRTHDE